MLLPACPHPCRDTAAKEVDHEEDAYGECYPMQAAFAGQMVDSDEEDFSAMDQKGGKGMSRWEGGAACGRAGVCVRRV